MIFGRRGLVVSGHRDLVDGDEDIIHKAMAEFIGYGEFDYIMFGGARGADTVALMCALDLRKAPLRLVVVVPDTLAVQPRDTWGASQHADRVIELGHAITSADRFWSLHHRNEFMIDWVAPDGRLLAFWNGMKSGTANAVHYAQDMGVEVSRRAIKGIPRVPRGPVRAPPG